MPFQERIIRDIFGTLKPNGKRRYNKAYIEIPKKNGKQLVFDTLIPTPDGYSAMRDLRVGDKVFDERGNVCAVVAKSDMDYDEQAYQIVFKDGETIEAGKSHQWAGEWRSSNVQRSGVVTTEWLYKRSLLKSSKGKIGFRIPVAEAIDTPDANLTVNPYLFGYWLGNGNAVKPEITIKTSDADEVLKRVTRNHATQSVWKNTGDSVVARIPDLKGVLLANFHDKKIPNEYLRASRDQRLSLLQGLMDSDGCVGDKKGQAVYVSTEKELAECVSELLWSLGVKNAVNTAESTQRADWSKSSAEGGRCRTGETLYRVVFTAFHDANIAGLKRKQCRSAKRNPCTRSHYRYIDKIKPIENRGMQCIQVNSPSRLYLAGRSMLPTHNSEIGAGIALAGLLLDEEPGAEIYSAATTRDQATIVFRIAAQMVRQDPVLNSMCRIIDSTKTIYLKDEPSSFYKAISADAGIQDGINP